MPGVAFQGDAFQTQDAFQSAWLSMSVSQSEADTLQRTAQVSRSVSQVEAVSFFLAGLHDRVLALTDGQLATLIVNATRVLALILSSGYALTAVAGRAVHVLGSVATAMTLTAQNAVSRIIPMMFWALGLSVNRTLGGRPLLFSMPNVFLLNQPPQLLVRLISNYLLGTNQGVGQHSSVASSQLFFTQHALTKLVSVPWTLALTIPRFLSRAVSIVTSSLTSLSPTPHPVISVVWPVTATMSRGTARIILVAFSEVLQVPRNLTRLIGVLSAELTQLIRATSHALSLVGGLLASAVRTARPVIGVLSDNTLVFRLFSAGHIFIFSPQRTTVPRAISKLVIKTYAAFQAAAFQFDAFQTDMFYFPETSNNVTVTKGSTRTNYVLTPLALLLLRSSAKGISAAMAMLVTKGAGRTLSFRAHMRLTGFLARARGLIFLVSQTLRVRLSRGENSVLSRITTGSAVSLTRVLFKKAVTTISQFVTVPRAMSFKRVVRQPQAVTTGRANRHVILIAAVIQLRLLRAVNISYQYLSGALGQVVTMLQSRGYEAVVLLNQTIALLRLTGKYLKGSLAQLVSLFFTPNVRVLNPSLFALGLYRIRSVFEVFNMSETNVLVPPIEPVSEFETVEFDYGLTLNAGIQIVSAVINVTVYEGTDPNPQNILNSYLVIGTSTRTQKPNQAVFQSVGNCIDGVSYRIQCVATTNDNQVKVLTTVLQSQASYVN